jgi:hypothetical protein
MVAVICVCGGTNRTRKSGEIDFWISLAAQSFVPCEATVQRNPGAHCKAVLSVPRRESRALIRRVRKRVRATANPDFHRVRFSWIKCICSRDTILKVQICTRSPI